MRTFVKIFHSNNDTEKLEKRINEFAKNKEIIDINTQFPLMLCVTNTLQLREQIIVFS